MSCDSRWVVGVDVGGTFTDLFLTNEATGEHRVAKVPSQRGDEAQGFMHGIRSTGIELKDVGGVIHGTTVGTNALLERKGAKTGIITTRGFRDVLEMRRRDRPQTWGLWGEFEPVVPRNLRLEVTERTLASGDIKTPVDVDEVREAAEVLLARGAESVCVVFINAYANDENERLAEEALRSVWPNDYVNTSSAILPEIREFERTSTTALNGYLQPVVGSYLERLETDLRGSGLEGDFLIVQSNGGVMSVDTARSYPVRTALSGPAAGVIAASFIAEAAGHQNVLTCDMGGTSFDVSLVAEGQSSIAAQSTLDFGMVIRTPMVEMTTIGAGGGSIAWVDRGGMLRIGPESAGSVPGPVCYGQGNERPTVTDANVVLGRINAENPIGGVLERLDIKAAMRAIETHVAEPLNLSVMQAAEAMIEVANAEMANALRLVSIERGYDPKDFVAMPFGGGGSLHAGALIQDVGLKQALVPRYPGVTSALGCTIADMRHDFVRTINETLEGLSVESLDETMVSTARRGVSLLEASGVQLRAIQLHFELDMSYLGQTHTVGVPLSIKLDGNTTHISRESIMTAFESRYRTVYGRLLDNVGVRLLTLRVAVIGQRPKLEVASLQDETTGSIDGAYLGSRDVWFAGKFETTHIYQRLLLPVGAKISGPAILEQPDTTVVIDPALYGEVDSHGNIVIARKDVS